MNVRVEFTVIFNAVVGVFFDFFFLFMLHITTLCGYFEENLEQYLINIIRLYSRKSGA